MKLKVNKKSPESYYREFEKQRSRKQAPSRFIVKKYTTKEWKRFNPNIQAELSRRYTVVLTDHKTRQEKMKVMKSRLKSGFKKGISNIGLETNQSQKKKKYSGHNYMKKMINIQDPNSVGVQNIRGTSFNSIGNFSSLASFGSPTRPKPSKQKTRYIVVGGRAYAVGSSPKPKRRIKETRINSYLPKYL